MRARLPEGKRRRWQRRWRTAASSSPPIFEADGSTCSRARLGISGRPVRASCEPMRRRFFPFAPRLTPSYSMRRALVWARCGAIRTSGGDDRLTSSMILRGRQLEMLQRAAAVAAPGGRIIYATCSSEPEEDEDVVTAFLSSHPDFTLAPERVPSRLAAFMTPAGHFRTLPFRDELEAFFAAILVKTKDLR